MVSADNLNLDVLELIFDHLPGGDLASIAVVSRSFLAGVIPRLYCMLFYRLHQAKKYPKIMSPFAAILSHPELAIHVRYVDIRHVPILKSLKSQLHPVFIRECTQALSLCRNLSAFTCSVDSLPPFLLPLQGKSRLLELRVNANITTGQAEKLVQVSGLQNLTLEFASWNMMDLLPKWVRSIQQTLTHLTLYMSSELNETVLASALLLVGPRLLGLHVIGCAKIDHVVVLRLVSHTPLLESLSFTTHESTRPLIRPPPYLPHLRNLAFDTRYTLIPSPSPTVLASILAQLRSSSPALSSFTIKLSDHQILVGDAFIQELLEAHALTLKTFSFVNCTLGVESITAICRRCIRLERLDVAVSVKELLPFTSALAHSNTLHTLRDMGDAHVTHGPRLTLSRDNIYHMMLSVKKLRKIVSDSKVWTGSDTCDLGLRVSLERRRPYASNYWFIARD